MMDYDLVVIGGGINGTGIAREAAYQGYRTLLLEKGDFASATSGQSTKLLHGGLRYLETGDFHLVWESLAERHTLLQIASHIAHPLEILIPVFSDSVRSRWIVRLGTFFYDLLAGRKNIHRSAFLSAKELKEVPVLKNQGLKAVVRYFDGQVSDSRLTLETALSAREAGADIRNYHPLEKAEKIPGGYQVKGTDFRTGKAFSFTTRGVVNATGPWVPAVEKTGPGHTTRPMVYDRGIHLVVPNIGTDVGFALMAQDKRLVFVLPWEDDYTLIGTTESKFEGEDFTHVPPSEKEIQYLLDVFHAFFPSTPLEREDVCHIYSGVRTLVAGTELSLTRISREAEVHVESEEPGSAWAIVYGGKLTSYRSLAQKALLKLNTFLGPSPKKTALDTATTPLYGGRPMAEAEACIGSESDSGNTPDFLTPALKKIWKKRYGSQWPKLVALAETLKGGADFVVERLGFTVADLVYMVNIELAYTVEDIILRRTKMAYTLSETEKEALSTALSATLSKTLAENQEIKPHYEGK